MPVVNDLILLSDGDQGTNPSPAAPGGLDLGDLRLLSDGDASPAAAPAGAPGGWVVQETPTPTPTLFAVVGPVNMPARTYEGRTIVSLLNAQFGRATSDSVDTTGTIHTFAFADSDPYGVSPASPAGLAPAIGEPMFAAIPVPAS